MARSRIIDFYSAMGFANTHQSPEKLKLLDRYIKQDVLFVRQRRFYHYYNEIPYTRWPFYLCMSIFSFLFYGLLFINRYEYVGYLCIVSFILIGYNAFGWFFDMLKESMVFGKYNRKVRKTIAAGFMLFLVSEILDKHLK